MSKKEWIDKALPYLIQRYGELGTMLMILNVDKVHAWRYPGAEKALEEFDELGLLIDQARKPKESDD